MSGLTGRISTGKITQPTENVITVNRDHARHVRPQMDGHDKRVCVFPFRRIAITLAGLAPLLMGCHWIGEGPEYVLIKNDSRQDLYATAGDEKDGKGTRADPDVGQTEPLSWGDCETLWLTLSVIKGDRFKEFYQERLEMCPGDTVSIDAGHKVTIECGAMSGRERDDC